MESPESWFEDFGEATLECGEAAIALDPDFAAVAETAKYHVFLTGCDGQSDLSVCDRTPSGFRVQAKDAVSCGCFSWRVVAKRKDIAGPRLETVEVPPKLLLPTIQEPQAAAEPPHPQAGMHRNR
jgi:hypothetical protein